MVAIVRAELVVEAHAKRNVVAPAQQRALLRRLLSKAGKAAVIASVEKELFSALDRMPEE